MLAVEVAVVLLEVEEEVAVAEEWSRGKDATMATRQGENSESMDSTAPEANSGG